MAFNLQVERGEDEANVSVSGTLVAPAALELFNQVVHLIDGGYTINLDLDNADFVGLGTVRALRTAALRAEKAGVSLRLKSSRSVYRIADLVGPERWSPLPSVEFEGDWVAA